MRERSWGTKHEGGKPKHLSQTNLSELKIEGSHGDSESNRLESCSVGFERSLVIDFMEEKERRTKLLYIRVIVT